MFKEKSELVFINKKREPSPSVVYDTYWKFATERQNIFFRRLTNPREYPWTKDFILNNYKFTNAYRVTDRVSQYLISEVIQKGNQDKCEVFFRIILFKLFNKIETWQYLQNNLGELNSYTFDFQKTSNLLNKARTNGLPIYSNAYIMASGKSTFNHDFKHENHLRLLERMMADNLSAILSECSNMEKAYEILLAYPTIGTFLAYQYVTDINYSEITNFSELEFVKAGPGAKDGIRKCFDDIGDYTEEDVIRWVCDRQEEEFMRLDLNFKNLWGRRLQLIDCQNLFCEVDKYSRVAHPEFVGNSNRTRIKQRFQPSSLTPINYTFPRKWGLEKY